MGTATTTSPVAAAGDSADDGSTRASRRRGGLLDRAAVSRERSWWTGAAIGISVLGIVTGLGYLADLQGKQGPAALYLIAVVVTTLAGGLWLGLEVAVDARHASERLMERGVLAKDTHETTLRLAPPLTATPEELDWALDRVEETLAGLSQ